MTIPERRFISGVAHTWIDLDDVTAKMDASELKQRASIGYPKAMRHRLNPDSTEINAPLLRLSTAKIKRSLGVIVNRLSLYLASYGSVIDVLEKALIKRIRLCAIVYIFPLAQCIFPAVCISVRRLLKEYAISAIKNQSYFFQMSRSVTSLFDIIVSPAVSRIARFILSSNENQFIHFFSALYPAGAPQTVIARSIDGSHYVIDMKARKIYNTFGRKEFLAATNTNTKIWCSIDPVRNAIFIRDWEAPKLLIYQEFTDRVPVSIALSKDYVAIVSVPYTRRHRSKDGISAEKIHALPDAAGSSDNVETSSAISSFTNDGQSLANFTGHIASVDVAYALTKDGARKGLPDLVNRPGVEKSAESGLINFTVSIYRFRKLESKDTHAKCELVRQSHLEFAASGIVSAAFDHADSSQLYIALEGNELITVDITANELYREVTDGYPWEVLSTVYGKEYNIRVPMAGKHTQAIKLSVPISCYGKYIVSSSRESSTLYKNGEPIIEGFPPATCVSPDSAFVWFYLNGVFYELDLRKLTELKDINHIKCL